MKRLLIVPSWARQAKRNKPQRFKQLPTSWWSVLHAYLKKLRQAARKSSASCQTTVNHSPHPSAPIKTLHQKVYPKQQLWQRLKGPSTDSHSTLGSNITSSCSQPSVNFSLRLSPAIPAGSHSFAHRGLSALSINHPSLKVSGISQLIDMNSLLKYASVKPLPLIIHASTPTLSILPLPESQHNQKKAALVYLPKQINHLPPLPPIVVVNKPPQPLDADGQWLANKPQVIDPAGETTNAFPEGSTAKETEPKKSTQKKLQDNRFEKAVFFKSSKKYQESRKRCHPYSDSALAESPKKPATLASIPDPNEIETPLIESENKDKQSIECDDYGVETTTEKWSGSELSNSEPSETETAIESDWCYTLAAYGYDTQRYPLLTQLPDDCHWGKRILRDFKPEYTFWLDNEEKSMLWGVRHYPVLAEFFQIDPLTYQHPYLEQAINAYTAPTESLPCSANPVAVAQHWQPQNMSTSPTHCLLAGS